MIARKTDLTETPPPARATRVVEHAIDLMECPICAVRIQGVIQVAAHMGDLRVNATPDGSSFDAVVPVSAEPRGMVVKHSCDRGDVERVQKRRRTLTETEAVPVPVPAGEADVE